MNKFSDLPPSTRARAVFAAAVGTSAVCMMLYAGFCADMYRDVANAYLPLIRAFAAGDWARAFHPALPPLQPVLAGVLAWCGVAPFTALIMVSGLFFVLTLFPLRSLLREFMSNELAAWGCLVYVFTPKLIRFSGSGLLESGRNFFFTCALALIFSQVRAPKWRKILLLGLTCGGLSLVRGEGIFLCLLLAGWYAVLSFVKLPDLPGAKSRWLCRIAVELLLTAAVAVAVMSPVLWHNFRQTGYPAPDLRIAVALDKYFGDGRLGAESTIRNRSFGEALKNNFRGLYEPYVIMAALGAVLLGLKRRLKFEHLIIPVSVVCCFVMFYLSFAAYRYFTLNIPLMLVLVMPFTAFIWQQGARVRFGQTALAAVAAAILIAQLVNGLSRAFWRDRPGGETGFGYYLAAHPELIRPGADSPSQLRFVHCGFASGGFLSQAQPAVRYMEKFDYSASRDFDFAVIDRKKADDVQAQTLLNRKDLTEIKHPFEERFILLTRSVEPAQGQ